MSLTINKNTKVAYDLLAILQLTFNLYHFYFSQAQEKAIIFHRSFQRLPGVKIKLAYLHNILKHPYSCLRASSSFPSKLASQFSFCMVTEDARHLCVGSYYG